MGVAIHPAGRYKASRDIDLFTGLATGIISGCDVFYEPVLDVNGSSIRRLAGSIDNHSVFDKNVRQSKLLAALWEAWSGCLSIIESIFIHYAGSRANAAGDRRWVYR